MFNDILFISLGVIHKGCRHKFPPPVRVDTKLALFETLQLVNYSH